MRSVNDHEAPVGGEVERLRLDELRRGGGGRDEAAVVATVASQSHNASVVVVGDVDATVVFAAADGHAAWHLTPSAAIIILRSEK